MYKVISINSSECGNDCLTLDTDYEDSGNSLVKLYLGYSTHQYTYELENLTPGISLFFRLKARVQSNLYGPSSYYGYPDHPLSIVPVDVPISLSKAELSPYVNNGLHIEL